MTGEKANKLSKKLLNKILIKTGKNTSKKVTEMSKKMTSATALGLLFGDSADELVSPSTITMEKVFLISVLVSGAFVYWTTIIREIGNQADAFSETFPKIVRAIKTMVESYRDLKAFIWPKAVSSEVQTETSIPCGSSKTNRVDKVIQSRKKMKLTELLIRKLPFP